jgi:hypothetical protein
MPKPLEGKHEDALVGPYRPDSPHSNNNAHFFFNEWAGLELYTQLPGPSLLPHFYGGDRQAGIIVMEDLGTGAPALADLLTDDNADPDQASQALIEYTATLGRLNALSIGHYDTFIQLRYLLGPPPTPTPLYQMPWADARMAEVDSVALNTTVEKYHRHFRALEIQPCPGFDAEIATVVRQVAQDPGPFLAFCQGDQNGVDGHLKVNGDHRMYDFDTGGFRHALLEGVPHRMTWGGMIRVPRALYPAMDNAFQQALAQTCPPADDATVFGRALTEAAAHWHIFHTLDRLPNALAITADQPISQDRLRGPSSLRQQVLAWTQAFADISEESGHLPTLGRSARDLAARLLKLWPAGVDHLPFGRCSKKPMSGLRYEN